MPIPGQHTASPAAETVRPDGPGRQDGRAAEKCWHLITIGKTNRWRAVTEALQRAIAAMGAEEGAPELFAPRVCRLHGAESGRPHRVETPLLLNYAFLRASAAELRTLRAACPEVNPVIDRASEASAERPTAIRHSQRRGRRGLPAHRRRRGRQPPRLRPRRN